MTLPLFSIEDRNLAWQQQQAQRNQNQQNLQSNSMLAGPADSLDPDKNVQGLDNLAGQIGNNAGNLAQQAAQQKAAEEQKQREAERQKAEQEAQQLMQEQHQQLQADMMQTYQDTMNKQIQAMFKDFKGSLSDWNAQINAQGSNFSGMGALGSHNFTSGNQPEIAMLAKQAGFPPEAIPTVVAIAMAESGGRQDAVSPMNRNGTVDRGLMQINSVHKSLLSKYDWKDPLQNMQMAHQIYKSAGNSFTPWSTFNNGAYNKYTNTATQAAQIAARTSNIQPANLPAMQSQTGNGLRNVLVKDAMQYIGVPYIYGGNDLSKGVDCSGLVQQVYGQLGIKLPRASRDQATVGVRTSISNIQPGDLVAWQKNGKVYHIAIYAGGGQIIESPDKNMTVRRRALNAKDNVFGVKLSLPGDARQQVK